MTYKELSCTIFYTRRRNVTTSMVGLENGHIRKKLTQTVNSRDIAGNAEEEEEEPCSSRSPKTTIVPETETIRWSIKQKQTGIHCLHAHVRSIQHSLPRVIGYRFHSFDTRERKRLVFVCGLSSTAQGRGRALLQVREDRSSQVHVGTRFSGPLPQSINNLRSWAVYC